MDLPFLAGTATGILTPMLCCLIGLVIFAWRGRGGTRLLGILGTALLFCGLVFAPIGMVLGPMLALDTGIRAIEWIALTLTVMLQAGGLVLIGSAIAARSEPASVARPLRGTGPAGAGPDPFRSSP